MECVWELHKDNGCMSFPEKFEHLNLCESEFSEEIHLLKANVSLRRTNTA